MLLLLLIALFIWATVDAGWMAGVGIVILAGIVCWLLSLILQIGQKLFSPRISLTQNNYSKGTDPTKPSDEHPLLQLHNYKRLH